MKRADALRMKILDDPADEKGQRAGGSRLDRGAPGIEPVFFGKPQCPDANHERRDFIAGAAQNPDIEMVEQRD
jgi:hypothetical protein